MFACFKFASSWEGFQGLKPINAALNDKRMIDKEEFSFSENYGAEALQDFVSKSKTNVRWSGWVGKQTLILREVIKWKWLEIQFGVSKPWKPRLHWFRLHRKKIQWFSFKITSS